MPLITETTAKGKLDALIANAFESGRADMFNIMHKEYAEIDFLNCRNNNGKV